MVKRTLIGTMVLVVVALLLWIDHAGARFLVPEDASAWDGLREWLENGLIMALVTSAVVWFGLGEYADMARRLGADIGRISLGAAGAALLILQWVGWAHSGGQFSMCPSALRDPALTLLVGLFGMSGAVLGWRAVRGRVERTAATGAHFALGLLYVLVPLSFIGGIRVQWGVRGVITMLAVCKFTDIGAYFAGKSLGGPKLAPTVSPRKTWAGVGGGILAATAVAVALNALGWTRLDASQAILFGILISSGGVVADLVESVLKREAGVKDSGNLLPGSGGILDMADDVLFAAPVAYLYFAFIYG